MRILLQVTLLGVCIGLSAPGLSGAADNPHPKNDVTPTYNTQDPYEHLNRKIFNFNLWIDHHAIQPVAIAYHSLLPNPVRGAIGGVFAELSYPAVMVNDLLQGLPHDFARDTARLVINGSIGLGGTWDPATHLGLPSHIRDFGQTLGKYGVPMGPYLMLPILGPEVLRDIPSEFVDRYASADWHLKNSAHRYELSVGRIISRRDELLPADAAIDAAFDPYLSVRDAYIQKRAYMVKEDSAEPSDDDLPSLEDLDPDHPTH